MLISGKKCTKRVLNFEVLYAKNTVYFLYIQLILLLMNINIKVENLLSPPF